MGLFSPRRQTVYGNDLFVTPLPIRYCRRLQQGKNEERLAVFTTSLSGAGNQIRTDDLVITNDVLYQLSYTSIPADLHSIPHNDVFVKWFCKNILRSSKQVLIAEIFKFTDGCHGCSAVLTPRKPFGFCPGLSRFAIHAYIIPSFFSVWVFVRRSFRHKIYAKKTTHGVAVIYGVLCPFVGQVEPCLHQIHP